MRRTQISLEERHYQLLKRRSQASGRSISALIREAVDEVFAESERRQHLVAALDASFGAWKDRDFDGADWVEQGRGGLDTPIGDRRWA